MLSKTNVHHFSGNNVRTFPPLRSVCVYTVIHGACPFSPENGPDNTGHGRHFVILAPSCCCCYVFSLAGVWACPAKKLHYCDFGGLPFVSLIRLFFTFIRSSSALLAVRCSAAPPWPSWTLVTQTSWPTRLHKCINLGNNHKTCGLLKGRQSCVIKIQQNTRSCQFPRV